MSDESIEAEFEDKFDPAYIQRQRDAAQQAGARHASRFLPFETDPELIAILEDFRVRILDTYLPAGATHAELAYHNGQRALILGIINTIARAKG